MSAQAPRHPAKPPAAGPVKFQAIPTEWRLELPEAGATPDAEFGGCRSIESGYHRGNVLGQGTYGEVRRRRRRRRSSRRLALPAGLGRPTAWLSTRRVRPHACCGNLPACPLPPPGPAAPTRGFGRLLTAVLLRLPPAPTLAAGLPGHRPAHPRQGGGQEDQDGQRAGGLPHHSHPRGGCCTAGGGSTPGAAAAGGRVPAQGRCRALRLVHCCWLRSVRRRGRRPPAPAAATLGAAPHGPSLPARLPPPAPTPWLTPPPLLPSVFSPHPAHPPQIKILSALADTTQEINGQLLRNNIIGLREIVRSGSHKANNYKGSIYMVGRCCCCCCCFATGCLLWL